jgi:hypothetical protein
MLAFSGSAIRANTCESAHANRRKGSIPATPTYNCRSEHARATIVPLLVPVRGVMRRCGSITDTVHPLGDHTPTDHDQHKARRRAINATAQINRPRQQAAAQKLNRADDATTVWQRLRAWVRWLVKRYALTASAVPHAGTAMARSMKNSLRCAAHGRPHITSKGRRRATSLACPARRNQEPA